jgi:hypothetical protein
MIQMEKLQTIGWDTDRVCSFVNFEIETTNHKERVPETEN